LTPAARLSAAIEVLDRIAATRQPAEAVLKAWGVANRYAGSGDRRAIGERVFACLREQGGKAGRDAVIASLAKEGLEPGRIDALFSGDKFAPAALSAEEKARLNALGSDHAALPDFIGRELQRTFGEDWQTEASVLLNSRAPVDLRVNSLRAEPKALAEALTEIGFAPQPTPWSAVGLRLEASAAKLAALEVFKAGLFEVQDEGSQLAAWLLDARPGETVVDYCAGGGGKTLALGQMTRGQGALIACDLNPRRLDAITPRLARAGLEADLRRVGPTGDRLADLMGKADRVLVDAPCSGSGTWRRRPEEAWRLAEDQLQALTRTQSDILNRAAALVRPGGRLAYVTCSVLAAENADVAAAFAANHPDFAPFGIAQAATAPFVTDAGRARLAELSAGGHTVQLSPRRTATDGFFIALFQRTS
jgi:16S rRNA (cytosine967-C5)-methyltransferase